MSFFSHRIAYPNSERREPAVFACIERVWVLYSPPVEGKVDEELVGEMDVDRAGAAALAGEF
ncbi:hypothetical protein, partial [Methanoculleus chikugoensis]|uniref:hypothetical protein n=1 Tax=Methanoculleus chikugoensis TaxID=118126 RepID=UPI001FB30FF5